MCINRTNKLKKESLKERIVSFFGKSEKAANYKKYFTDNLLDIINSDWLFNIIYLEKGK